MSYNRQTIVKQAQSWIGCKESDGSHKKIIDVYNSHKPLARGYAVKYTDAWCATFVSACAIAVGYTDILPTECSCTKMIALFQNLGRWVENDAYVPDAGDVIFYDWQDSGSGDNTGVSDHVGLVEKVVGSKIYVIEGNYSDQVKERTLNVNGKYIRGFGIPKYDGKEVVTLTPATTTAEPKTIWNYLKNWLGNDYGVAGLMGNLQAESALLPMNVQNSYEKKVGTDAEYTAKVDAGTYTAFATDSAGYGLAQWTYSTRKKNLLAFAQEKGASIGNLDMQLEFLKKEMQKSYSSLVKTLKNATSVKEASDAVLTGYEKPANQGDSVKKTRASYGQKFYDTYATKTASSSSTAQSTTTVTGTKTATASAKGYLKTLAGTYKTTANLNIRNDAGTSAQSLGVLPKGTEVHNYGYFTNANGVRWLYIQATVKGIKYTGFSSSAYLSKV